MRYSIEVSYSYNNAYNNTPTVVTNSIVLRPCANRTVLDLEAIEMNGEQIDINSILTGTSYLTGKPTNWKTDKRPTQVAELLNKIKFKVSTDEFIVPPTFKVILLDGRYDNHSVTYLTEGK